jgi:hypothetical protein
MSGHVLACGAWQAAGVSARVASAFLAWVGWYSGAGRGRHGVERIGKAGPAGPWFGRLPMANHGVRGRGWLAAERLVSPSSGVACVGCQGLVVEPGLVSAVEAGQGKPGRVRSSFVMAAKAGHGTSRIATAGVPRRGSAGQSWIGLAGLATARRALAVLDGLPWRVKSRHGVQGTDGMGRFAEAGRGSHG